MLFYKTLNSKNTLIIGIIIMFLKLSYMIGKNKDHEIEIRV